MKKLFLMFAVCLFGAAAYAQSLGDVARANRAKKHASTSAVKLDDDSMPHSSAPSAGSEVEAARKADDKSADAKEADSKDAKKDTADAEKQKNEELKKQIDGEKKEIATLQREPSRFHLRSCRLSRVAGRSFGWLGTATQAHYRQGQKSVQTDFFDECHFV